MPAPATAPRPDSPSRQAWRDPLLWLALVATAGVLFASYHAKEPCVSGGVPWDGSQYLSRCFTDMPIIWHWNGFADHKVPYVEVRNEYPAVTGIFQYAAASFSDSSGEFFGANAIGLGILALATTLVLHRMLLEQGRDRRRVLLWAAAPSLFLYAFHNWDVLAVFLAVAGLWAYQRNRWLLSGALLATGAMAKVWPGLLLPFLALELLRASGPKAHAERAAAGGMTGWQGFLARVPGWPMALRFAAGAAAMLAAWNLPFLLRNPGLYWDGYQYQFDRGANQESFWYAAQVYTDRWGLEPLRSLTTVDALPTFTRLLLVAALLLLVALVALRRLPGLDAGFAAVLAFLLTNLVYSAQYSLWVVPFLVLLRWIPWWVALPFFAADFAVHWMVFDFFGAPSGTGDLYLARLATASALRHTVLLALFAWVLVRAFGAGPAIARTLRSAGELVGLARPPHRSPRPAALATPAPDGPAPPSPGSPPAALSLPASPGLAARDGWAEPHPAPPGGIASVEATHPASRASPATGPQAGIEDGAASIAGAPAGTPSSPTSVLPSGPASATRARPLDPVARQWRRLRDWHAAKPAWAQVALLFGPLFLAALALYAHDLDQSQEAAAAHPGRNPIYWDEEYYIPIAHRQANGIWIDPCWRERPQGWDHPPLAKLVMTASVSLFDVDTDYRGCHDPGGHSNPGQVCYVALDGTEHTNGAACYRAFNDDLVREGNPWAWRGPSAVLAALGVLGAALAARRIAGSHLAGLLAGLFVLSDSLVLAMGRMALFDIYAMGFAALALWSATHATRSGALGAGLFLGLAFASKYTALFAGLPVLLVALWCHHRAGRLGWARLAGVTAAVALVPGVVWILTYLPWWLLWLESHTLAWAVHSWVMMQQDAYDWFTGTLAHPATSPPGEWLLGRKPVWFFQAHESFIYGLPNLAVYWSAALACLASLAHPVLSGLGRGFTRLAAIVPTPLHEARRRTPSAQAPQASPHAPPQAPLHATPDALPDAPPAEPPQAFPPMAAALPPKPLPGGREAGDPASHAATAFGAAGLSPDPSAPNRVDSVRRVRTHRAGFAAWVAGALLLALLAARLMLDAAAPCASPESCQPWEKELPGRMAVVAALGAGVLGAVAAWWWRRGPRDPLPPRNAFRLPGTHAQQALAVTAALPFLVYAGFLRMEREAFMFYVVLIVPFLAVPLATFLGTLRHRPLAYAWIGGGLFAALLVPTAMSLQDPALAPGTKYVLGTTWAGWVGLAGLWGWAFPRHARAACTVALLLLVGLMVAVLVHYWPLATGLPTPHDAVHETIRVLPWVEP